MNDIKKGALVQLKSGGPTMTVCSDRDEDAVYCQWFVNSKLESGQFALAVLTVQADDDPAKSPRLSTVGTPKGFDGTRANGVSVPAISQSKHVVPERQSRG